MFLLHAGAQTDGIVQELLVEVFWHGFLDTLKLVPFLFVTYLFMEFIEHRATDKVQDFLKRAGGLGALVGGILGAVPQCGFSAAAANLYAGRVVTLGTLVAVFLSTSDEMLPIMVSGSVPLASVLAVVAYKALVGMIVGVVIDIVMRLVRKRSEPINIDAICDEDNCHCERGILHSALHHTLTISLFVLAVTFVINGAVFAIGEQTIATGLGSIPVLTHAVAAVIGLIPNCAASVALSTLCAEGMISVGTMMAGLFSNAGVGLLVLFRVNKKPRENFAVVAILVLVGFVFGLVGDALLSSLQF